MQPGCEMQLMDRILEHLETHAPIESNTSVACSLTIGGVLGAPPKMAANLLRCVFGLRFLSGHHVLCSARSVPFVPHYPGQTPDGLELVLNDILTSRIFAPCHPLEGGGLGHILARTTPTPPTKTRHHHHEHNHTSRATRWEGAWHQS